jgi:hypothetical protein
MSEPRKNAGPPTQGGRRATDPIEDLSTHPAPMITLGVCAGFLGVRTRQIWKWHRAGLLELWRVDERCVRVETEEFRRFVEAHRLKHSS